MSVTKRRWHDDWLRTFRGKGTSTYAHKRGPYVAYSDELGWDVRRDETGGGERLFVARTLAEAATRLDEDPGFRMFR